MSKYTIDHEGRDGRWRVWWIGPTGYGHERLFNTRASAARWVDETEALEAEAMAPLACGLGAG